MPQAVGAIIAAGITAATGVTVSAGVAGIIGSVVVTGALVGAQLVLAPKPDIPKPQDGKILLKQAASATIYGVGTSRIGGSYAAYEMAGSTSYDVIALQQGRTDQYRRFYLNDDLIQFEAGVDGPVYKAGAQGRYMGNGANEKDVALYWRLGAPVETAYQQFVDAAPEKWPATSRGDGVSSALLVTHTPKDKNYTKRLPFGLPKPSVVGDWSICWDPRDPDQIEGDPATWKFTQNPFVVLLWYYCHCPVGYGQPAAEVYGRTADWWKAAMDVCDEPVARASGVIEPRYVVSGNFTSETPRKSVVGALLRACDGWLEEQGDGSIVVYAGAYYEPNLVVDDRHVLLDDIKRGYLENEAFNRLIVKCVSQEHDYNEVEADPTVDQASLDAGAIEVSTEAQAEWSPSWTQSKRLAAIELDRRTAKIRGTLTLDLFGENLRKRRFFMLNLRTRTSTRMIPCERTRLVDDSLNSGTFQVEFTSVRPERYLWDAAAQEGAPPPIPDNSEDDDLPIPNLPTLSVQRQTVSGGGVIAVISATNPPVEGWPDLTLAGDYRRVGDAVWIPMTPATTGLQVFSGAVTDGDFEVQTRYIGGGGGEGENSPTAPISVISDPTPPDPAESIAAVDMADNASVTFVVGDDNDRVRKALIYRATGSGSTFDDASAVSGLLAASPGATKTWVDTGLTAGADYNYWVVLLNGSSVASDPAGPATVSIAYGNIQLRTDGTPRLRTDGSEMLRTP